MSENKKGNFSDAAMEKEIVYSRMVKAGKRIYYLDVKRSRKNDLFLSITESKKVPVAAPVEGEEPAFTFEKHKIFLYKEDMQKFCEALEQVVAYIRSNGAVADELDAEGAEPNEPLDSYLSPAFDDASLSGKASEAPSSAGNAEADDLDFEVKF